MSHAYRTLSLKRRAWITLGVVVLGGGGVAAYAVASPSDGGGGAALRDKRPVKVYDLALPATATDRRELPRKDTEQFSLLGVSWTGATKRLHGTAQVRTHSIATGEWSGWRDLELDADPLEKPETGTRGASEPLWVGASDGVQVQVARKDGTTTALPKGLQVNLVDPGVVTDAEAKQPEVTAQPAGFAVESDSPTASTSAAPTDTISTSATPTASASTSASESTLPSASATVPTAPPQPCPSRRSLRVLAGAPTSPRSMTRRRTTRT